jgi:hypothetical protein
MRHTGSISVRNLPLLLLTVSAGELIFQAKRDTASYLKELAAAGKITYTLVATGASLATKSHL